MSSRKPGYMIAVILLALVLTTPQILVAVGIGLESLQNRQLSLPVPIPGLGSTQYYFSTLQFAPFWRGKFVYGGVSSFTAHGLFDWTVWAVDPETGETTNLKLGLPGGRAFNPVVLGDRMCLVVGNEAYEVVDGVARPSDLVMTFQMWQDGQQFVWKGDPAVVEGMPSSGFTVSTLQKGALQPVGVVVLPASDRDWMLGGIPIRIGSGSLMQVYDSENGFQLFLHSGGRLLHHRGLELELVPTMAGVRRGGPVESAVALDQPVSALKAANTDAGLVGWSLVREKPAFGYFSRGYVHGLLIERQPTALIVDDASSGHPVGRLYRLEGTTWTEFASQPFPFGSQQFRTVVAQDGLRSYVVASTSTGDAHVYALEATGFRKTNGAAPTMNQALLTLLGYGIVPVVTLVLGMLLGAGTWFLMRWYTKPDFGFGLQTVKLASLGRRGLARLIDLGVIGLGTVSLGWLMTRSLGWLSLAEALNLKVEHPVIPIAAWTAFFLAQCLTAGVLALIAIQGRWGITPGKWLCGLRTLRTTLQPCGFTSSLTRELVFFIDCGNFLCWTPGILSIAFTDCRQRLGDLVADTLVVEARSFTEAS